MSTRSWGFSSHWCDHGKEDEREGVLLAVGVLPGLELGDQILQLAGELESRFPADRHHRSAERAGNGLALLVAEMAEHPSGGVEPCTIENRRCHHLGDARRVGRLEQA